MLRAVSILAACAALSACVSVTEDAAPPRSDVLVSSESTFASGQSVTWLATPRGSDLIDVYPLDTLNQGVSGSVLLACVFLADGTLGDCTIERETPPGLGFGAASLRLVEKFRFDPVRQPELIGKRGFQPLEFRVG